MASLLPSNLISRFLFSTFNQTFNCNLAVFAPKRDGIRTVRENVYQLTGIKTDLMFIINYIIIRLI